MYNQNRLKVLNLLHAAPQHIPGELVFLLGNPQEERTNSDTDILFRQDSNFLYARPAGRSRLAIVCALTMRCGGPREAATPQVPHGLQRAGRRGGRRRGLGADHDDRTAQVAQRAHL